MPHPGRLELQFVDVGGLPLADTVNVRLRHHVLHEEARVDSHDATRPLAVAGLRTEPQGLYRLEVEATCYWPVARFVTIPASGETRQTITLPIRPTRARPVFPDYRELDARVRAVLERSHEVRGHEGLTGQRLFEALRPVETAGLLNIAKKSLTMPFEDGADLLHHVTVREIREDRCFVDIPSAVKDQMQQLVNAGHFDPVNGSLHEPPVGFVPAGSFKTPDAFGNLQMTFFVGGDRCVADIDIDDAAGLGHVFQVMRNHLTGKPTHPYNIHQILVKHQNLHPGYDLLPKTT
ncbi:MAG TPA: hypothetical protein VMO26_13495 [Vicinamibacterales bacterium]|nr:hypothetical protein [Vicinamibacterales bacterium]